MKGVFCYLLHIISYYSFLILSFSTPPTLLFPARSLTLSPLSVGLLLALGGQGAM